MLSIKKHHYYNILYIIFLLKYSIVFSVNNSYLKNNSSDSNNLHTMEWNFSPLTCAGIGMVFGGVSLIYKRNLPSRWLQVFAVGRNNTPLLIETVFSASLISVGLKSFFNNILIKNSIEDSKIV